MRCTEVLRAYIPPDIKLQVRTVAERACLSEAAWLKRLVLQEIRSFHANGDAREVCRPEGDQRPERPGREQQGCSKPMLVRLRTDDRLLLGARAEARGMRPATYASVLLRAHLRTLTPLPKEELAALKLVVSELGAVGRNLNQIAKATNQGTRVVGLGREEFRAILKICAALRDHTKDLSKSNNASWATGYAEDAA